MSFDDMLSVLEKFSLQHSMRLLNGGKNVEMQADDPYFTALYTRNHRTINRVVVYHLDDGAEALQTDLFEVIGAQAVLEDCGGYTSSIPKNWRLEPN